MSTPTQHFISQSKLRELQRQRDGLCARYDELSNKLPDGADEIAALRALYDGLKTLRFATHPLHPEVTNLEMVLYALEQGRTSPEQTRFWKQQLSQELAQGRLRAEAIYLFGTLLEEWASVPPESPSPERLAARDHLLARAAEDAPPLALERLDALVAELLQPLPLETSQALLALAAEEVRAPVSAHELGEVLERLHRDDHRSPALRREAQDTLAQESLCRELADALTITLEHLEEWSWPTEGVPVQALWTHTKWRLHLTETLPTTCLLEILGKRWQDRFTWLLDSFSESRRKRLQYLDKIQGAEGLAQAERQRLEGWWHHYLRVEPGLWPEGTDDEAFPYGEEGSILQRRAWVQATIRSLQRDNSYAGIFYESSLQFALMLVQAELMLARAVAPEQPIHVLKVDIKDFYPSLSHELLLHLLQRLGLPERDLAFFRRFLALPLQADEETVLARRGVPPYQALSDLLAELTMRLLDQAVSQAAPVQVIRTVDDICVLAPSAAAAEATWRAIQDFCARCGLELNASKCGAVALGDTPPSALPAQLPTWQLLQLEPDGTWGIHWPGWEAQRAQAREDVDAAPSLLARVARYNASLLYLAQALALGAPLGAIHRARVGDALGRFQADFFGEGRSIEEGLRQALGEAGQALPAAWLYWPITAGGLGLLDATTLAGQYAHAFDNRREPPPPTTLDTAWQRRSNEWALFYEAFLEPLTPIRPQPTPAMEKLVQDFIRRGQTLSGGKQQDLSPYWRWILASYGPPLLAALGTFRFLITELVPLHLILQQRLDEGGGLRWEQR